MSVYLVLCRDLGLCKIGYASNVARRLAVIATFVPAEIELIAVREGDLHLESAIHRALKSVHHHGEWFKFSPQVVQVFKADFTPSAAVNGGDRAAIGDSGWASINEIFALCGGPTRLAKMINLKRASHATAMKTRGSIPSQYWPRLVSAANDKGIGGITFETLASAHARPAVEAAQ